MSMSTNRITGVPIYPSVSNLPASFLRGSLAVTADTGILYEFNGTSWVVLANGSGGGGGAIVPGTTSVTGGTPYEVLYVDADGFANQAPYLYDVSGIVSVDFTNRNLIDSANNAAIVWEGRFLYDATVVTAIDWQSRLLYDSSSTVNLNWSTGLGFFGATPIAQPSGDIPTALAALGLVSGGTISVDIGSSISSGTSGSVLFINGVSELAQDNANFFYNQDTFALILGSNTDDGSGSSLQAHGVISSIDPPNTLTIMYDLDVDTPYFIADGTDRFFRIYAYYKDAVDIVGTTSDQVDPNDGQGYDVSLSWGAGGPADGYYVYDVTGNQYTDAGNTFSFTLTSATSITGGAPPSSPTTFLNKSANFYGDVIMNNSLSITSDLLVSGLATLSNGLTMNAGTADFFGGAIFNSSVTNNSTNTFNGATVLNGSPQFNTSIQFTQQSDSSSTGTVNNLGVQNATFIRFGGTGPITFTGFVAKGSGQELFLYNPATSGSNITLANQNAGSTAANRIANPSLTDLALPPGAVAHLIYNSNEARWIPIASGKPDLTVLANTWSNLQTFQHISGSGTAPTIVAGVGAGTSPTVSVAGTDLAGAVTITTGSTPTGSNAIVGTITFNSTYTTAPRVILQPANANTALLTGVTMVYVTSTATTFVITSGSTALTAATVYLWNYHVIK